VFNIPDRTTFGERMNRYAEAVPHIIAGHALYRQLLNLKACRKYLEAVRLAPEDRATLKLLDFDELKLRIAAHPSEPWAYRELGSVYFEQGRYSEAVTALSNLLKNASSPPINATKDMLDYHRDSLIYANKTIGICYIKAGDKDYARPYLEKALELKPDDAEIKSLIQKINSK